MLNFAVPYHSIGKNIEYRYTAQPEFQLEMLVSHAAFLEKSNLNVYVAIYTCTCTCRCTQCTTCFFSFHCFSKYTCTVSEKYYL